MSKRITNEQLLKRIKQQRKYQDYLLNILGALVFIGITLFAVKLILYGPF